MSSCSYTTSSCGPHLLNIIHSFSSLVVHLLLEYCQYSFTRSQQDFVALLHSFLRHQSLILIILVSLYLLAISLALVAKL
jgi:hypothetical protein